MRQAGYIFYYKILFNHLACAVPGELRTSPILLRLSRREVIRNALRIASCFSLRDPLRNAIAGRNAKHSRCEERCARFAYREAKQAARLVTSLRDAKRHLFLCKELFCVVLNRFFKQCFRFIIQRIGCADHITIFGFARRKICTESL